MADDNRPASPPRPRSDTCTRSVMGIPITDDNSSRNPRDRAGPMVVPHGQTALFYGDTDIEVEHSPTGGRRVTIRVRAPTGRKPVRG